jgi:ABC-type sugar transport system permease subunit
VTTAQEAGRTRPASRGRQRGILHQIWRGRVWYAFALPPFALLVLFVGYPTFETFRQSLFRPVGRNEEFAGLEQFEQLAANPVFWGALLNTVVLAVSFLMIVIPLSVVLASLVNRVRRGSAALKVIYFLPQLTSSVAVALIFNYVFQPDWGLLNGALQAIGVEETPLWLSDPRYGLLGSRAAVTILAVWTALGYFMLIFLAGLQGIPIELYEAAALDGAGGLRMWWSITLPSLRPTLIFLIITGTVDAMARFSDLWTLGGPGGAPARSLQTIVMYMYQVAFESGNVNRAAAIAVIFFVLMLCVTLISYRSVLAREFKKRR